MLLGRLPWCSGVLSAREEEGRKNKEPNELIRNLLYPWEEINFDIKRRRRWSKYHNLISSDTFRKSLAAAAALPETPPQCVHAPNYHHFLRTYVQAQTTRRRRHHQLPAEQKGVQCLPAILVLVLVRGYSQKLLLLSNFLPASQPTHEAERVHICVCFVRSCCKMQFVWLQLQAEGHGNCVVIVYYKFSEIFCYKSFHSIAIFMAQFPSEQHCLLLTLLLAGHGHAPRTTFVARTNERCERGGWHYC